jgi:hypothetical protein
MHQSNPSAAVPVLRCGAFSRVFQSPPPGICRIFSKIVKSPVVDRGGGWARLDLTDTYNIRGRPFNF